MGYMGYDSFVIPNTSIKITFWEVQEYRPVFLPMDIDPFIKGYFPVEQNNI